MLVAMPSREKGDWNHVLHETPTSYHSSAFMKFLESSKCDDHAINKMHHSILKLHVKHTAPRFIFLIFPLPFPVSLSSLHSPALHPWPGGMRGAILNNT